MTLLITGGCGFIGSNFIYTGVPAKAFTYNDPDLNINWPVKSPVISQRDRENITIRQAFPEKFK